MKKKTFCEKYTWVFYTHILFNLYSLHYTYVSRFQIWPEISLTETILNFNYK